MVWVLRLLLAVAVLAYAAWLAQPLTAPFLGGQPVADSLAQARTVAEGSGSPQAGLWLGAIALYIIGAVLIAIGHTQAAGAYFMGFVSETLLRLTLDQVGPGGAADIATRAAEAVAPVGMVVDPAPIMLAGLVIVGLLVLATGLWGRRHRGPRTFPGPDGYPLEA